VNRAERLSTKRFDAFAHETKVSGGDSVQYRDRLFKKSGQSFETIAALPSPNGRWLAVFSHTSEKDLPSYGVMGGGGRVKAKCSSMFTTRTQVKESSRRMRHTEAEISQAAISTRRCG